MTHEVQQQAAQESAGSSPTLNWVLALATVLGVAAVEVFAYVHVLGSAGCSDQTCNNLGLSQLAYGTIVRGAPVIAVVAVGLSFYTARRRLGYLVPLVAWILLLICFVALAATFP